MPLAKVLAAGLALSGRLEKASSLEVIRCRDLKIGDKIAMFGWGADPRQTADPSTPLRFGRDGGLCELSFGWG
jgi:hypothetical protein